MPVRCSSMLTSIKISVPSTSSLKGNGREVSVKARVHADCTYSKAKGPIVCKARAIADVASEVDNYSWYDPSDCCTVYRFQGLFRSEQSRIGPLLCKLWYLDQRSSLLELLLIVQ